MENKNEIIIEVEQVAPTAAGGRTPGNDIITPSHCTKLQSDGYNCQSGI